MKPRLTILFTCVFLFVLSFSCKKHNEDKKPDPITHPTPVKPDLTVKVMASVSGFVTDESNNPVVFAQVNAGDKQAATDQYGYFKLSGVSLAKTAGFVKVTKTGLFSGYKTFSPLENGETFVRIQLLTKTEAGVVDAAAGGTATTADGGKVTLPANGVVVAANGTTYSGQVHISARWINPADNSSAQLSMPGDLRGTDSAGYLNGLKSFGVIGVELTGSNGQLLQIAAGKTAVLNIPIPSSLSAAAPVSINLWSFNDSTGLWRQEGQATKVGGTYVGAVAHFSFWDGAQGLPLVNFKARIVDGSSRPLANVAVSLTIAGQPQNAGYSQFGYTDTGGYVTGAVYANMGMVLDIVTPCALSAYSHPFTTLSGDVDLGTLTGNLGQNMVTISGRVNNCSNQPVSSGYVQTYDHGFYNRIAVNNGNFSFTGITCTNTVVDIVAVDNGTYQQNTPQTVTLVPGVNDLGLLVACGTSTMGSLSYTIDGVTKTITEPSDTIAAYFAGPQTTQIVVLSKHPNTDQQMSFQIDGGLGTGDGHHVNDVFCNAFPGGRATWPVPIVVSISEYGDIGGFISGSFSGNMLDFPNNGLHTISCTFRIRRYN